MSERDLKARPRCATLPKFIIWLEKQRIPANPIDHICQDCNPIFKQQMLDVGRCDWPDVKFYLMSDGTMEGRRTSIPDDRGYPEGTEITTWPLRDDPTS